MKVTKKQIQIIRTVAAAPDHTLDMDEILEQIPYETSKESMQFSLRALVAKGLLVKLGRQKRRKASRVVYQAAEVAIAVVRHVAGPSVVVDDDLGEFDDLALA